MRLLHSNAQPQVKRHRAVQQEIRQSAVGVEQRILHHVRWIDPPRQAGVHPHRDQGLPNRCRCRSSKELRSRCIAVAGPGQELSVW